MPAVSDTERLDVFVADAGSRPGLVAVRDLGRAELAVGALDIDPHAAAFASRWCRVGAAVPDFHADRDAYLDAVIEDVCHRCPVDWRRADLAQPIWLNPQPIWPNHGAAGQPPALSWLAEGHASGSPRSRELRGGLRAVGEPGHVRSSSCRA